MDLGGQSSRRPALALREIVERYRALAGRFGKPVALSAFGLLRQDGEELFSALDEDYHISRFVHFTLDSAAPDEVWSINSFPQSHVSLDEEIQAIL